MASYLGDHPALGEQCPCCPLALYGDEGTKHGESTLVLTVMPEISPVATDALASRFLYGLLPKKRYVIVDKASISYIYILLIGRP